VSEVMAVALFNMLILLSFLATVQAQTVHIATAIEPPLTILNADAQLDGLAVDFVEAIQEQLGKREEIVEYPWARAYKLGISKKNTLLFSTIRTPEREDKFHWISLISRNSWKFYGQKGSAVQLANLDQIKHVESIGVIRGGARASFLIRKNFTNLNQQSSFNDTVRMLNKGRISLVLIDDMSLFLISKKEGVEAKNFEAVYELDIHESYLAMSKSSDIELVERWKEAAEKVKSSGTFEKIARKWQLYIESNFQLKTHYKREGLNLWEK
jgi:polar amino acid transport system substrate-binding protein